MGDMTGLAGWELLTDAQRASSERMLTDERGKRRHLVVSLSGAHAYGFPSPDSDVDLKAIHIAPTATLVGLHRETPSASRMEWIDGVEMDYSSNEIGVALGGVLKGNGNYLERVLGHAAMATSPWLEGLQPIVRRALSRRVHHHYHGFAKSQFKEFESTPTVKKLLYVLRTSLTGTHLLRTGSLVVDVTGLLDEYGYSVARDLVTAKRRGENVLLDEASRAHWHQSVGRAFTMLDEARDASILPTETPNLDEVESWLLDVRRTLFDAG